MLLKKIKEKNDRILQKFRDLPCFVCNRLPPSDPDHFKSKEYGGGDNIDNLNSLCRSCHILRHQFGIRKFWKTFSKEIIEARQKHNLPPLYIPWMHK